MRDETSLTISESANNQRINQLDLLSGSRSNLTAGDTLGVTITTEEQEILANYAKRLCASKESEMLILSPSRYYFYDAEEMKNIKVVTSFTELNKIDDLKGFLKTLYSTLQPKTFFIGHFKSSFSIATGATKPTDSQVFVGNKIREDIDNGIISRYAILNRIYSILDARSFTSLSSKTVELHLRNYGFKVVDMTPAKTTTCFIAQRISAIGS